MAGEFFGHDPSSMCPRRFAVAGVGSEHLDGVDDADDDADTDGGVAR